MCFYSLRSRSFSEGHNSSFICFTSRFAGTAPVDLVSSDKTPAATFYKTNTEKPIKASKNCHLKQNSARMKKTDAGFCFSGWGGCLCLEERQEAVNICKNPSEFLPIEYGCVTYCSLHFQGEL